MICCHKKRGDREEVVGKFLLISSRSALLSFFFAHFALKVNHEPHASLLKEVFDEIEAKSRKPVSVGNHNFFEIAAERGVQNGTQAGALVVESGADVGDDFVVRIRGSEISKLPFEISTLTRRGDPPVDDLPLFLGFDDLVLSEALVEVLDVVEAASSGCADAVETSRVGPLAQRILRDAILSLDERPRLIDGCL